ncbi:CRISPR-associated endonuclease Cas3'' [Methylophaga nitratireducenticrescens]|uniref:CRISPR-associated endonuclease Cas3-HD n=1 Tax=Methylophaga nitratireducenticrescens TaxID=754476 RepID=I1XLY3_METNJ|nr:CRISPR-associated endonuclease Cas3'' [Methylophaga nitratireducenticrescens]AFI85402.1 CRISPR-associated endonuclease Cas3'' [Methylophaga nitratireducenticrescens]AUZ85162.1 CRISPR-associated endonuclease Cas3'' [Methylophaga nitratireducenticrescens]
MMVTFVSQCEKKALARTRRVLDAFADRIGDNTWQTVITQEGLNAVRKLLRKTASKNTAVSCHWIRSRSRSELVWVVGRTHVFNHRGVVPVNFTSKEVIMDRLPIETGDLLANTRAQALSKHLFAAGFVAHQILDALQINNQNLKQAVFIAGIFHDIGKIDPEFQNWVNKKLGKIPDDFVPDDGVHIDSPAKFSFEKHPRHHELSWIFAESLMDGCSLNDGQRKQIAHAIYWHHTKPFRKEDKFTNPEAIYAVFKKSLAKDKFEDVFNKVLAVIKDVGYMASKFEVENFLVGLNNSFSLTSKTCPDYKKYDGWADDIPEFQSNVRENALNNLVRSAVISADRLVSSRSSEDLEEYLAEGSLAELNNIEITQDKSLLKEGIEQCLYGFISAYPNSQRNEAQSHAAKSLADLKKIAKLNNSANIGVLQGPAGCGKTKIALEWALKTDAEKIIWVCPRVQVCLGLLHDLTAEEYLPDGQIEIFTGEYKKILGNGRSFEDVPDTDESDYFSGDIVITTIDQVVNSIRSHSHVDTFIQFMNAHVVFDEFHELVNMPAFNLLFAELIEAKKQQGEHANTLLVSATPNYFYLTQFLGIQKEDIITIDSFNASRYQIDFINYDEKEELSPLIRESQQGKTFVITNTALDAQLGYLQHHGIENSVLLHSKYTKQDKAYWFDAVFNSFKRNGSQRYEVLRSGPIVQASLNITCDRMLTEITNAENWLQRLGRLDRFGENEGVNPYITVIPKSLEINGKQTSSCARFLNQMCVWNSTKAWLSFLKERLETQKTVTINQLYEIYRSFYTDKQAQEWLKQDFLLSLKKSVELINKKIIDPISVPPKSKLKQGIIKISANSLRGDNRFVQMAVCEVLEDQQLFFSENYASSETFNPNQPPSALTESIETMRGYGNDDANLVQFMQKKHHNIKSDEGYKKARNEWELIKEARSPESPIYLSYTPKDLSLVNSNPHPQAVYYVISNRQPVGAMSIAKLKNKLKSQTAE